MQARLYTPQPITLEQTLVLDKPQARHLIKVLRVKLGESVMVFNGDGGQYQAQICALRKESVTLKVLQYEAIDNESPLQTHLYQAITRSDKMDWIVQKATELGVSAITPVISARCKVKLNDERFSKKRSRWHNIMLSAAEQSQRTQLVTLHAPVSFSEACAQARGTPLILMPGASHKLSDIQLTKQVSWLSGPESGFSDNELTLALEHGFSAVNLGPRVLRCETAPLAMLAMLQQQAGDL